MWEASIDKTLKTNIRQLHFNAKVRGGLRQLHRDKEVLFAGYKLPHPLEYRMLVKVQTRGRRTPRDVVDSALGDLAEEFMDMKAKFRVGTSGALSLVHARSGS